jgi:SpoVK/Ycf46/Vps4 family AAA+-type ATPase
VWLETRLPDEAARAELLRASLADLPEPLASVNVETLAQLTRGLTGADLKAAVDDAKLLFAHDMSAGSSGKDPAQYFRDAVNTIRKHRRAYGKKKRFEFGESAPVGFLCEPR